MVPFDWQARFAAKVKENTGWSTRSMSAAKHRQRGFWTGWAGLSWYFAMNPLQSNKTTPQFHFRSETRVSLYAVALRFESLRTPLSKLVIHLYSVLMVCESWNSF